MTKGDATEAPRIGILCCDECGQSYSAYIDDAARSEQRLCTDCGEDIAKVS